MGIFWCILLYGGILVSCEQNDLIQRLRPNVVTTMSRAGTWAAPNTWNSSNAIDGIIMGAPNSCSCCSSTSGTEVPWWQIDLGGNYSISSIKIFGRSDGSNPAQYSDLSVYVHDKPMSATLIGTPPGTRVYHGNITDGGYTRTVTLSHPMSFRYMMIRKFVRGVMTLCEVQVFEYNLIQRLRPNVVTTMSSTGTWNAPTTWNSRKAIDGIIIGDPNSCSCCSSTRGTEVPWWQIDLGRNYSIGSVKIFGRSDRNSLSQYDGLSVYVDDNSMAEIGNAISAQLGNNIYSGNITDGGYMHTVTLSPPRSFRYMMIRKNISVVMTICEVQVFEYKCMKGKYGQKCDMNCSTHCLNGVANCDSLTGSCKQGCDAGYMGLNCSSECPDGTFGGNCSQHCHCMNASPCNKSDGHGCKDDCAFGWTGDTCSIECPDGTFGANCLQHCHCMNASPCNKSDGHGCKDDCAFGWTGDTCSQECPDGTFGVNCSQHCHCMNASPCNKSDGHGCKDGCAFGWTGDTCSQECPDGTFGVNCLQHCHCMNATPCNKSDGHGCKDHCAFGWTGDTCSQECPDGTFGASCLQHCHCMNASPCNKSNGHGCKDHCASGWTGDTCSQECPDGTFGANCLQHCHCMNASPCNTSNGHGCKDGCAFGWTGDSCSQECPDGTFGANCSQHCHCMNASPCNKSDGHGCNDDCAFGWTGDTCSHDLNLIHRLKDSVTTNQSSVFQSLQHYNSFKSTNAIDGVDRYDIDTCQCCSVTDGVIPSWWQINLGNKYLIDAVEVFGRQSGQPLQLQDAIIYADNVSLASGNTTGVIVYIIPTITNGDSHFIKQLNSSIIAQYFIITLPRSVLTLCEFKLYEKLCDVGRFGAGCSHRCHCSDQKTCNSVTGICQTPGCLDGWQGLACDQICSQHTFGAGCNTTCHCLNSSHCDPVNGTCDTAQCDPGWEGLSCSDVCSQHKFGAGCNTTCHCLNSSHCDPVNGTCDTSQCDPGWEGLSCSDACNEGTFGPNCLHICHCFNGSHCTKESGDCKGGRCDPGWQLQNCSQACHSPKYGYECSNTCYCLYNATCDHINGTCENNSCEPGWQGDSCNKVCDHGTFGYNCSAKCHCLGNTSHDAASGICDIGLCEPGWQNRSCDEVCDHSSFGKNCSSVCNCRDNTSCEAASGTCNNGLCEPGWNGSSCNTECEDGKFGLSCFTDCHCNSGTCPKETGKCRGACKDHWQGETCSEPLVQNPGSDVAAIGGGAAGAVLLIAAGVILGIMILRRKKAMTKKSLQEHNQFSHLDKALAAKQSSSNVSQRSAAQGHTNMSFEEEETSMNAGAGVDYYEFGPQYMGIRIHQLWDYIRENMENKCEKFFKEFMKLPSGLAHSSKVAEINREKNRYREMYAYDHSRVVLDVDADNRSDYINACYIDGFDKLKKFVASQGPTMNMIDDFWRMAWQLKSDKIVMLTNLIELGMTKCLQYWPDTDECSYGSITITLLKTDTFLDYNIRHLEIRKDDEMPRRIRQFHFKSWPDKDVPDSTWCLVSFWRAVETNAVTKAGPIIVHCSAGVGRTGTFIALDNVVSQSKTEGCIRPLQMVEALRRQRVNMVQTKEQYVYLHEALADALLFGTHIVWTKQFEDMYRFMLQRERDENKTRLELQFDLIMKSVKNSASETAETVEYSNVETLLSESDAYKPKLPKRGSTFVQELGALYIPSYKGRNTFLVARSPDKNTMEEFWSVVDDINIKTIIMLTESSSTCYQTSCELGSHPDNGNRFSVNKIEETIRKGFTERTYTFKESIREDEKHRTTVKQFEYTAWKDGYGVPGDTLSLLDMINSVQEWQPHLSETQPILIHCGDGYTRTGIVCVFLNELQRMKYEGGHINIVESVKMMQKRQSLLINNFAQYTFCYDMILAHIRQTEVYENL